jgi:DNA invertase Pin-like site-specific DNA recombinase
MAAPKRATSAQIINALRKAEVQLADGKSVKEVCKGLGISEQTYYRRLGSCWTESGISRVSVMNRTCRRRLMVP